MHKWNAQWDGLLARQLHICTSTEERLMQRNKIFSIKGVTVDAVKMKHNSYGKIISDKMIYKTNFKKHF